MISQIEKSHIRLEQVHTSNVSTGTNDNTITFQFQFILVDTSDKYTGQYYLTAGVEYGNQAYVWVGQAAITTAYQVRVRLYAFKQKPLGTVIEFEGQLNLTCRMLTLSMNSSPTTRLSASTLHRHPRLIQ